MISAYSYDLGVFYLYAGETALIVKQNKKWSV